jgi:hypothetical protein
MLSRTCFVWPDLHRKKCTGLINRKIWIICPPWAMHLLASNFFLGGGEWVTVTGHVTRLNIFWSLESKIKTTDGTQIFSKTRRFHTGGLECLVLQPFESLTSCDHSVKLNEGVSKSFRTGRMERELQMVQLSATRCSCIAILWVSLVSFAAITLCVASQRVFIVVSVYFVIDSVRKLLDTPSYVHHVTHVTHQVIQLLTFRSPVSLRQYLTKSTAPECWSHSNLNPQSHSV